jgi:hypothetical protein
MPFATFEEDFLGCFIPDDGTHVGARTLFAAGVEKDLAAKWMYRVKKWKITADFTGWAATATGGGSTVSSTAPELEVFSETLVLSEIKMTCPFIFEATDDTAENSQTAGTPSVNGAFSSVEVELGISFFGNTGTDGAVGYTYNGLYWPAFFCRVLVRSSAEQTTITPASSGSSEHFLQARNDLDTDDGVITCTIDGIEFDCAYQFSNSTLGSGASTTGTTDISLIITPEEFWGWDPGDGGGPYYDTATGAKIRN